MPIILALSYTGILGLLSNLALAGRRPTLHKDNHKGEYEATKLVILAGHRVAEQRYRPN
eukprot:COSAG02_NODE_1255_length_13582_cov_43.693095_3_plen_59_part_00